MPVLGREEHIVEKPSCETAAVRNHGEWNSEHAFGVAEELVPHWF